MILKNSYFKLMREDMKHRLWTLALSILGFFFLFPVGCAMRIEQMLGGYYHSYREDNKHYLIEILGEKLSTGSDLLPIIVILGAVICGISGFAYLHSKKKIDFYHSLPVSRSTLFCVSYLNGILIFFIPYLANLLLAFAVCIFNGLFTGSLFANAMLGLFVHLLGFLLIYTVTVLAVMLTGNYVVSFLATLVFLCWGPAVLWMQNSYFLEFFATYYNRNADFIRDSRFLSPLSGYCSLILSTKQKETPVSSFITIILIILMLTILALFLYKLRPSEAAGKAISFRKTEPVIKFLLVIPITFFSGILFLNISSYDSPMGWMIFGLICGFFLSTVLIEIIFRLDFNQALAHKLQMLISGVFVILAFCCIYFDWLGFDAYQPEHDKIESMAVAIDDIDGSVNYNIALEGDSSYVSSVEYQLKNMRLTDFSATYDLSTEGIRLSKQKSFFGADKPEWYFSENMIVKYQLKSGRTVYRKYPIYIDGINSPALALMSKLYESPEYLQSHFPIFKLQDCKDLIFTVRKEYASKQLELNENEKQVFLDTYKQELMGLNIETLMTDSPVAAIEISSKMAYPYGRILNMTYYVYPGFTKTLELLRKYGFDVNTVVDLSRIQEIQVERAADGRHFSYAHSDYKLVLENNNPESIFYGSNKVFIDKSDIEKIYTSLVWDNFAMTNINLITSIDQDYIVTIVFSTDQFENKETYQYYFKKDRIPDLIFEN